MKKLTDWFPVEHDVENTTKKVLDVFSMWYRKNLVITRNQDATISKTFGFPYTSTQAYAGIWNTNCEALLKTDLKKHFEGLALNENLDVIALFTDYEENWSEITIGRI